VVRKRMILAHVPSGSLRLASAVSPMRRELLPAVSSLNLDHGGEPGRGGHSLQAVGAWSE
jgi:hypothetical protein